MKTRVSGVPYEVELGERCPNHGLEIMNFSSISETIDHYEVIIATLEQENKSMRARMNRLEEELNWLENQSRHFKDDLK